MNKIVKPKAFPGDKVMVLNSRKKPAEWEEGEINATDTRWNSERDCYHVYRVKLNRQSYNPKYDGHWNNIFLYVGDDKIKQSEEVIEDLISEDVILDEFRKIRTFF